jgi:putative lipoic acid-binding regulatory protein
MSSISNQSSMAGLSPRQSTIPDAQFSNYVRKQSFSAYESLDAGLSIKTKEGDLITLTSSSYAEVDAFMYDSKGVLQTDSGKVMVSQNIREITLRSGESFTFSVVGDLNEEELEDIEAIVKGIDEVISQMAVGDMEGAVAKAVSMGGYDSVSMYAADITYQRSYAMTSEVQAETVKTLPEAGIMPEDNTLPGNYRSHQKRNNSLYNIDKFIEKMMKNMEKFEEKLIDKAQTPIDKLFRHH